MSIYKARRNRIYDWMANENITMIMIEDAEGRRDSDLYWLSGQPGDSLLFLSIDRQSVLVPWDVHIAAGHSSVETVIGYSEFERHPIKAARAILEHLKIPHASRVELPPTTSYPNFLKFIEGLSDYDVLCREDGSTQELAQMRAIKDEEEIKIYRKVSAITNEIITLLEKEFESTTLKTETDIALFIEAAARSRGCEGTGFETIAAGPTRSFGIHAVPSHTSALFGGPGLSILDFGLKLSGYTTDVTITVARGPLSRSQERMLTLVEKAYARAFSLIAPNVPTRELATAVDEIFGKAKKTMPHGLGHGIGLEVHEAPSIRSRGDNTWNLLPGMIFTLEPGLYDPIHGGCRLENDILLTEKGAETLTKAKIIRL